MWETRKANKVKNVVESHPSVTMEWKPQYKREGLVFRGKSKVGWRRQHLGRALKDREMGKVDNEGISFDSR